MSKLDEAVQTIIETRDLCGNEAEALRDWQSENGKLTAAEIMQVHRMAESVWRKNQLAAGVDFPLSGEERMKAYRDINSGK